MQLKIWTGSVAGAGAAQSRCRWAGGHRGRGLGCRIPRDPLAQPCTASRAVTVSPASPAVSSAAPDGQPGGGGASPAAQGTLPLSIGKGSDGESGKRWIWDQHLESLRVEKASKVTDLWPNTTNTKHTKPQLCCFPPPTPVPGQGEPAPSAER